MYLIKRKLIKFIILVLTILILDQYSKYLIDTNYNYFINKNFIIISFKYIKNYGAAFNIFDGNRIFLSSISLLSSLVLIYYIFIKDTINTSIKYGLSFILAGSLGNGIDRILKGYVIDFIKLNSFDFPIFNIADISINIGCILLIFNYFKYKK